MTALPKPAWQRLGAVAAALAVSVSSCSNGGGDCPPPMVAVLSAFPGELRPLVDRATIHETVELAGRVLRVGELGGVPVVLGMTGIGLENATNTTRAVLDRFDVEGVIVSGVAGSFHSIGDVAVPEIWTLVGGGTWTVDREWYAIAERLVGPGTVPMETCTELPLEPEAEPVCVLHQTALYTGGFGRSDDPFDGLFPCQPGDDDVFGCDIGGTASTDGDGLGSEGHPESPSAEEPAAVDMETAAIIQEADARGLRSIAFRAVSDGPGDPLGLPGFPAQFFAYYRLAARNAARGVTAFLEQLASSNSCR